MGYKPTLMRTTKRMQAWHVEINILILFVMAKLKTVEMFNHKGIDV